MAIQQVAAGYQNDGNYCFLDLFDEKFGGPLLRIETFRCSQPNDNYGNTPAGTSVIALTGKDHLTGHSNRTFRHIFSAGERSNPKALLEIREIYDEHGAFEVRTRDIDGDSASFGVCFILNATPTAEGIALSCEVRVPERANIWPRIYSPVTASIPSLTQLADISEPVELLGKLHHALKSASLSINIKLNWGAKELTNAVHSFSRDVQEKLSTFSANVQLFERMGDFRDKCIHDGTNLTGNNVQLASERIYIRAYRVSLITLGRFFDPNMSHGVHALNASESLSIDPKPGVYSIFLQAYALNMPIVQLGLDKVHSDYGGIPMKLAPGSRLENNAVPVVDATNLNKTLTYLAALFYAPETLSSVKRVLTRPVAWTDRAELPMAAAIIREVGNAM